MSDIKERLELIRKIEETRNSRVLAFITGDRPGVPAQIGEDAVRHVVEHLRRFGPLDKLDVFLYSRGGSLDVPWQLISAFRDASKEWSVLIPFRAYSAATMIALGADHIIMGPQAQLGPIDPSLSQDGKIVSVEDVMAFIDFIRDRVGLSDQIALTNGLSNLTTRVDALTLGSVYRTHSHIRDVARKIINSRKKPPSNQVQDAIIATLAEEVNAHSHAISPAEARKLELPVHEPSELDESMWRLLSAYESHMKLLEPWDPQTMLKGKDKAEEECVLAMVESTEATHEFITKTEVSLHRQMPQSLNVNLNINFEVPTPDESIEEMLVDLKKQLQEEALSAVLQALESQAPPTDIGVRSRVIGWRQRNKDTL